MPLEVFNTYITSLAKTTIQDKTEHTDRGYLNTLLTEIAKLGEFNAQAINEQSRQGKNKDGFGAPDFTVNHTEQHTVIGYIENKQIDENLNKVLKSKQIEKYKKLSENLILTDYLEWIWIYKDSEPVRVRLCDAKDLYDAKFKLSEEKAKEVYNLIAKFYSTEPDKIASAKVLAEKLARPSIELKKYIAEQVELQIKNKEIQDELYAVYEIFKEGLFEELATQDFADGFAQMLTYSIFLAKLNTNTILSIRNSKDHIPQAFSLIKTLSKFLDLLSEDKHKEIKWAVENILSVINNIDAFEVAKNLSSSNTDAEKDAYIYFYEYFLKEYDAESRVNRGVYYTPPAVVQFIVNQVSDILQEDFNLEGGLKNNQIKLLDFACGTGTFLFESYKKVLEGSSKGSNTHNDLIEHLLANFYGFEIMISSYIISHLKLSQFLKDKGYDIGAKDNKRIGVYLTNTLENKKDIQTNLFAKAVAEEGREANKIKDNKEIIAIIGNPPYNVSSQNVLHDTNDLKVFHDSYKPKDEKSKGNIEDDYIKFIAFAHKKIANAGRGVIGVIVNNSFLKGLTHRKMRNEIMKDFDKIYIIDLHGNSRIKETSPDGSLDQNVFDIMQGVCIIILVKNDSIKDKGIFHIDIYGKRSNKFKFLYELRLGNNPTQPPLKGEGYPSCTPPLLGEDATKSQAGLNNILKASKNMNNLAKELRKNMTKYEKMFWYSINKEQLGVKFRRQSPLFDKYIVDFVCFEKRLIIEIDGGQHYENLNDKKRDEDLSEKGFRVIRFWNNDIYENLDNCIEVLKNALNENSVQHIILNNPTQPPLKGEGYPLCIPPLLGEDATSPLFTPPLLGEDATKSQAGFARLDIHNFNKAFRSTKWGKERFKDDLSFFAPMQEATAMLEYGQFWGLTDIFAKYTSGLMTGDDKNFITFEDNFCNKVENYYKDNVKNIMYRPFDIRKTYYDSKLLFRTRNDVMQHMLLDNIGLCFARMTNLMTIDSCFVTNYISECKMCEATLGSYIAALYLYKSEEEIIKDELTRLEKENENLEQPLSRLEFKNRTRKLEEKLQIAGKQKQKIPNFKPDFVAKLHNIFNAPKQEDVKNTSLQNSLQKDYHGYGYSLIPTEEVVAMGQTLEYDVSSIFHSGSVREDVEICKDINYNFKILYDSKLPSPEEVLAFIYAQMHSPSYRAKYLELLKIDFPRINFNVTPEEFYRLAVIGQELIEAHLMRKIPKLDIGECYSPNFDNIIVQKPDYNYVNKTLHINKETYFEKVSPDIWEFKIGGYQVLDKYLKARMDRVLNKEEIKHVTNIIKALGFTIATTSKIDINRSIT